MAILKTFLCGSSLKRGSFFSGFFSLGFYMVVEAVGILHVNTDKSSKVILVLSLAVVMFAGFCIFTSILLLVGLCVDYKVLMLPWICSVSITSLLDVVLSSYLLSESTDIDLPVVLFFAVDLSLCALNIYGVLCVLSWYQACSESDSRQRHQVPPPVCNRELSSKNGHTESEILTSATGLSPSGTPTKTLTEQRRPTKKTTVSRSDSHFQDNENGTCQDSIVSQEDKQKHKKSKHIISSWNDKQQTFRNRISSFDELSGLTKIYCKVPKAVAFSNVRNGSQGLVPV